jgi:hypothetical protein
MAAILGEVINAPKRKLSAAEIAQRRRAGLVHGLRSVHLERELWDDKAQRRRVRLVKRFPQLKAMPHDLVLAYARASVQLDALYPVVMRDISNADVPLLDATDDGALERLEVAIEKMGEIRTSLLDRYRRLLVEHRELAVRLGLVNAVEPYLREEGDVINA